MSFNSEDYTTYLRVKNVVENGAQPVQPVENSYNSLVGKRVIVRSRMAGVMYGTLVSVCGQTVILNNARNLYRWRNKNKGASLNDAARHGLEEEYTKLSAFNPRIEMLEACSIIEVSHCAQISLDNLDAFVAD